MIRDKIRGSLFGGAVGDALGYPVEFIGEYSIFSKYGDRGITSYELNKNGKAVISDDTQMVLFTANGLLAGNTAFCMQGKEGFPRLDVEQAYLDWLLTQISSRQQVNGHERFTKEGGYSWLLDVPELYARRAPGITCLRALEGGTYGKEDFIRNPRNDRKGCGGIMRVAPVALMYRPDENCNIDIKTLDWEAAQIAAITHGHSLGYMPAAVVSHIITRILTSDSQVNLKEIVLDARDAMKEIFSGDENLDELVRIIELAVSLSENSRDDLKNIHALGEGWVAEETLGISLYCA
ncbi:MAG: ADP-ribosylglycohydrolase family protein, partial [Blautia sp.]|nr:ADP-ribosylglycohydrolase family protein [Blautia sp.]